jgi:hypothetical protein
LLGASKTAPFRSLCKERQTALTYVHDRFCWA